MSLKSAAVNVAAPFVDPSAAALLIPIVPVPVIVPPVKGDEVPIEVTVPPVPVAVSVEPENESPEPRVISEAVAPEPVGFPRSEDAPIFCNFAYVTAALLIFPVVIALLPIVNAPVFAKVRSPDTGTSVATLPALPTNK